MNKLLQLAFLFSCVMVKAQTCSNLTDYGDCDRDGIYNIHEDYKVSPLGHWSEFTATGPYITGCTNVQSNGHQVVYAQSGVSSACNGRNASGTFTITGLRIGETYAAYTSLQTSTNVSTRSNMSLSISGSTSFSDSMGYSGGSGGENLSWRHQSHVFTASTTSISVRVQAYIYSTSIGQYASARVSVGRVAPPTDTDNDNIPDYLDIDSDNDGVLDSVERRGDPDGDGIFNFRDLDSDGDGCSDLLESGVVTTVTLDEVDGIPSAQFPSSVTFGNNGLANIIETSPESGNVNYTHSYPTATDASVSNCEDSDDDGVIDSIDIDDDNDGIVDSREGDGSVNTDGDAYPDSLDIDSDNDGIPDNIEAQSTLAYQPPTGNDDDKDGLDNAYDDATNNGLAPHNTDRDVTPDYLDSDSDNDSVPDSNEGHDHNFDGVPDVTPSGNDTDGDGLDDAYEGSDVNDGYIPNNGITDPLTQLPNTDGTDDVNFRDLDDDNDGVDSVNEDENGDGDPTNDDFDRDGRPDFLDDSVDLPDLGVILQTAGTIVNGKETVSLMVRIRELNGINTFNSEEILVKIDKLDDLAFDYDDTLENTKLNGKVHQVNNAAWTYESDDPLAHIFRCNQTMDASTELSFGISGTFDPNNSKGETPITVRITTGSGGEIEGRNNLDTDVIAFFPR